MLHRIGRTGIPGRQRILPAQQPVCQFRVQGRRRRSIPAMDNPPQQFVGMEEYPRTLLPRLPRKLHRQRHRPRAELPSPHSTREKPFLQLEQTFRAIGNHTGLLQHLRLLRQRWRKTRAHPVYRGNPRTAANHPRHGIKNVRVLDRTFNYNTRRAKELLELFLEFAPDIRFHLEMHPALLSEELKEELKRLPEGLLHLEAGIQSLREPVLVQSRRMGRLSDALEGLKFLCALPNMETHADLIAGLPLYHLSEIFEDIRVLAEYGAGEIQLESLKLLPGTEMRRRAEELGIQYSPFPPYEVLQTREINVDELQTARQLSRLLDGFYNAPAWQGITRRLILDNETFLHDFLEHLIRIGLIDQPMSLENGASSCMSSASGIIPNISRKQASPG